RLLFRSDLCNRQLPAASCIGLASKQAREHPPLFRESRLRARISLVGGELEEPRGLAIVFRQPATALPIEPPEKELRLSVSLVGGEFVKPRGPTIVLRQPATT